MAFVYRGEMVQLGSGRGWLNRPAALSLFRLDARIGHAWQINEAGRTWDQQNEHFQRYLRYGSPIALSPDAPSLHQIGNAIDTDERITWLLNEYGWFHTVYRWVNGVWTLVEPWHYEYFPEKDQHINEGAPAGLGGSAFPQFDYALNRRKKERTMYVASNQAKDVVYEVYRDRNGQRRMVVLAPQDGAFARQGGLVIESNPEYITQLANELQYGGAAWAAQSVRDEVWGTTIDRYQRDADGEIVTDADGNKVIVKISALQELADIRSDQIAEDLDPKA